MPRTATERRIIESRNAKGILVPILEELLERQLEVEDEQDEQFMLNLMRARAAPREKGIFSPSMLGSCVRQAYFAKTGQEKKAATSPRTNGYFLDGNFRHFKWQFALWKAHRAGLLELLGVEVRVFHPNGDFAGTIDAVVVIRGELFVVDFKGMYLRSFQTFEQYGTPSNYVVQIVGYCEIVNQGKGFASFMGSVINNSGDKLFVKRCLLVGESKSGPGQKGSPIALHEDVLDVKAGRSKVKNRIRELRGYVEREEIPAPACTSTRTKEFQECPFAWFCRGEVKDIQRAKERDSRQNPRELRVRKSSRGKDSVGRT